MNLQQISEKIRDHLTQQKALSIRFGTCAYRGENGRMCAVGCLIKDEFYKEVIEERPVFHPSVIDSVNASGISFGRDSKVVRMLQRWQGYHDSSTHHHFNYRKWIDGDSSESPAEYHKRLMEEFA